MQTLSDIRNLLATRGLRPKHRLGQNFLHDQNLIRKLIDAAGVAPAAVSPDPGPDFAPGSGNVVLEVGPGTGALTEALLERGADVIACELDGDMAAIIEERLREFIRRDTRSEEPEAGQARAGGTPAPLGKASSSVSLSGGRGSLTLIRGDCLAKGRSLNPQVVEALRQRTAGRSFKLVANLPYQAASPLMSALAIDHPDCAGQFVTIQKEVADRLAASPGTKEYGSLSIIIQAFSHVERIATLSPGCFWPAPEVTSAMVAITPRRDASIVVPEDRRRFARFITGLFTKRRKQLGGTLGRDLAWPRGVTPDRRPDALSADEHIALWRAVEASKEA